MIGKVYHSIGIQQGINTIFIIFRVIIRIITFNCLKTPFQNLTQKMVPRKGLEPSLSEKNYDLNVARLPIPPSGQCNNIS